MVVELVQHLTLHLHQILMQFKALLVLEGVVVEQEHYPAELHQELREQMVVLELL